MTAPTTSKDSYTIYGMLYTIEEVQRTTTESMLYLQEKVGMTFDESTAYLRMLRVDELKCYYSLVPTPYRNIVK